MPTHPWIEIPLIAIALIGPLLVVILRLLCKNKTVFKDGRVEERSWGIGVRMIQLVGVLILVPIIALLMFEGKINPETGSALLGVALGYTLSGIEKAVPK